MTSRNLVLTSKIFKSIIVSVEYKLLLEEIMMPMFHRLMLMFHLLVSVEHHVKIFKSIMVSVEYKLSLEEIRMPMFHRLNYCIELNIVCTETKFRTQKFFTEKGNWTTRSAQNCYNTSFRCITMQLKQLGKIRKHKKRSRSELRFDLMESRVSIGRPSELSTFQAISDARKKY